MTRLDHPGGPLADTRPDPATGRSRAGDWVSVLAVVAAAVGLVVYAVADGLSVTSAVLALGAIALTQVLPGALLWRAVRPRDGWLLEDLGAGFALGSAIAIPTQVVAGLLQQRWLALTIPLVVAAALVATPVTRRRIRTARWSPTPWWFGTALGLLSLVGIPQLTSYFATNRISYPGPTTPHNDTYLHQALATELLNRGPVAWPTVLGEDLGYHWFTHAWLAQVAASSGVELDQLLLRLMPAIMPMAVTLAVAVTGLRLGRRPWVGVLAAAIAMVGGRFNFFGMADPALPMTPLSPTLALGAPTLLLLVTVLALRWRGETQRGAWVLVPLLAVVASGTKGSTAPLVVAGLGLAVVAMFIWNRAFVARTVVDLLVVAGGLVFALIFVFHGSSAGLALGVTASAKQTALGRVLTELPSRELILLASGTVIAAGLSRAVLALVLPFFRDTRRDPLTWVLLGASAAGAIALGIFSHPGLSQGYFYLTAVPLGALGSALGVQRAVEAFDRRFLVTVGVVGILSGVVVAYASLTLVGHISAKTIILAWKSMGVTTAALLLAAAAGAVVGLLLGRERWREPGRTGRRWTGALTAAGLVTATAFLTAGSVGSVRSLASTPAPDTRTVTLSTGTALSQGQIDVARFIRDHSDVNDVVMTNRHCTVPRSPFNGCDSRRWIVTAFSERQLLVEGWTATPEATRLAPHGRDSVTVDYWKPDILRLNDGFTVSPTADAQRRLWDLGVRWAYVENTIPHADSLAPYAVERFRTADASAWELLPPSP